MNKLIVCVFLCLVGCAHGVDTEPSSFSYENSTPVMDAGSSDHFQTCATRSPEYVCYGAYAECQGAPYANSTLDCYCNYDYDDAGGTTAYGCFLN